MPNDNCDKYNDFMECLLKRMARFETDCALSQRLVNGRILTGPVTYFGCLDFLTISAFPNCESTLFTNASGTPLPQINPGDMFYVSVPDTNDTYKVDLAVYLDLCPREGTANSANAALVGNDILLRALAGLAAPRANLSLPECYLVFDSLSFYINLRPAPCGCGCGCGCCGCGNNNFREINGIRFGCGCIQPRGKVQPDTNAAFRAPCCNSRF